MTFFTHVLCPIDFSDTSTRALTYAAGLASQYGAELTVLHVVTMFNEAFPSVPGDDPFPGTHDEVVARMRRVIEQVGATASNAKPVAQKGRAADVIVSAAASMNADLIVIGTQGLTGLDRLIMGSVAESVVRSAPCPVLTIPPAT